MIEVTPTRTVAVSLLIHAAGIALLLTIRSTEPIRARPAPLTLTALQFHLPARARSKVFRRAVRPPPLAFRVPDRSARLVPRQASVVAAEPPSIQPAPMLLPGPVPGILELPPAPVRRAPVATGSFGDASVAAPAPPVIPPANPGSASANFFAAEILFKPRPVYTDDARRLQIEGEVLLEVLFGASGGTRVLRTIRGLGHGLDEKAISAASEIRFLPARRGGVAVDSSAVVHIVFQLAY